MCVGRKGVLAGSVCWQKVCVNSFSEAELKMREECEIFMSRRRKNDENTPAL